MKKLGFLVSALTLLMVGCSNNPTTPTAADTLEGSRMTTNETQATETQTDDASNQLSALGLSANASTAPTKTAVRADGTLLVNGQPMFPMGFYHVSWAGDAARRLRDLNAIADLGFNVMNATMFDPESDLDGYRKLLDTAQSRGMKLLVEDFNNTSIKTLKSHPAVLGWMVADDCNSRVTPAELQRRSTNVKSLDSDHLTYTSMAISNANNHAGYFGKADAIGNQSYPIDGGDSINVVYPVMSTLVAQSKANGTLPIANLQSFRWENGRYPTPLELTNMTNQALAAGVKGILYYTYLDKTNDMAQYKGLNAELKQLSSEVKQLAPVLMNGTRQELVMNQPAGQATAHLWQYGGHRYLQVINLNDSKSLNLKVNLPANAKGLTPLFAGRPAGMTLSSNNTVATGTLSKLSVHWYEVL